MPESTWGLLVGTLADADMPTLVISVDAGGEYLAVLTWERENAIGRGVSSGRGSTLSNALEEALQKARAQ